MTKDKWNECWIKATDVHNQEFGYQAISIDSYPKFKKSFMKVIKLMDEATEVYEMENNNERK